MRSIIAIGVTIGFSAGALAAPGDMSADAVLGQSAFNTRIPDRPDGVPAANNFALSNAADVAIGPNGRLYVSDPENNRVLSWPSAAGYATGQPADQVFGQPGFTSNAPNNGGVGPSGLSLPQGVFVDASGNLWVTDAFDHRVLKFNNPQTDATPTTADLVIGQVDLFHNQENLGQGGSGPDVPLPDSLQFPGRVLVIGTDVWLADSGNSRVLHYTNVVADKPFADRVFGQFGNFFKRAKNNDGNGQNGFDASADNLLNPIGITVDATGSLYIADWGNHRILRYDNPILGDMTADEVIGQPDFVHRDVDSGGPALGLTLPIDLFLDAAGRMLVADSGNNRILLFSSPRTSVAADLVFGQFDSLSSDSPNHGLGETETDADGLFGPTGVALDTAGNLHVVDTNNHRVLRYDSPFAVAGDINCDGVRNGADVVALVQALTNPAAFAASHPGCDILHADLNGDLSVNGVDVTAFVALETGP